MGFLTRQNCFIVAKLLAAACNLGSVSDVSLPVTLPVLTRLVVALPTVFTSRYKCLMLRAMMVLAFKAYLQVEEMVPLGRNMVQGCLHMGDVLLSEDIISLSFRRFKHSTRQGPQSLHVKGECIPGSFIYPASFLREFQSARGGCPPFYSPLVIQMDHQCCAVNLMFPLNVYWSSVVTKPVHLRVTASVLGQLQQLH